MFGKIIAFAAGCVISNPTGRKAAVKSFKVLSRLADHAVHAMPDKASKVFINAEKIAKDLTADDKE